jgi:outer membrane receptor protein involved in Fe transport
VAASSRHTSVDATLRRDSTFVRASSYDESRGNGTPLTTNDTRMRQVAAGGDWQYLGLRGYLVEQHYHQTFSAIAADRKSERLAVDQRVPSRAAGGSADLRIPYSSGVALVGGDVREVSGTSYEQAAAATRAGGHQRALALRAMLLWQRRRLSITGGVRADDWRNFDAEQNGTPLPSRHDKSWSPRVTALYELTPRLSLAASAYSAFRAPTLNELYRGFRAGNVVTQPNAELGPEHLNGFELGLRAGGGRVTLFAMRVADTIANVTLSTTPALITRRRQNLGSSRSRGIEAEWSRVIGGTSITAGYLFADATLSTGRRTPQVARHQATLQAAHRMAAMTFGLQTRWSSRQFDDDLNQFPLRRAFVADLFASRTLLRNLDLTMAVENLFDARVEASATPVITLGQPRAARIGLRYALRR